MSISVLDGLSHGTVKDPVLFLGDVLAAGAHSLDVSLKPSAQDA